MRDSEADRPEGRILLLCREPGVWGNLGTGVSINVRLIEAGSPVPYLAACVWDQVRIVITLNECQVMIQLLQHAYVGPNVMDFLMAPPMPEYVECYELYELETQETSEPGGQERKVSQSGEAAQ